MEGTQQRNQNAALTTPLNLSIKKRRIRSPGPCGNDSGTDGGRKKETAVEKLKNEASVGPSYNSAFQTVSASSTSSSTTADESIVNLLSSPSLLFNPLSPLPLMSAVAQRQLMATHALTSSSEQLFSNHRWNVSKQQRPFKAYNPTYPLSALQVNSVPGSMNGSHLSPKLISGLTPAIFTEQLLQQYRRYVSNSQNSSRGFTVVHRTKSAESSNADSRSSSRASSLPASTDEAVEGFRLPAGTQNNTPSPPEVTSTSHPHTEHVSPPSRHSSYSGASSDGGCRADTAPQTSDVSATVGTNISSANAGRRKGRILPDMLKDEAYWERRRKNNEAAKRSRDARRAKEDEIAVRAAVLEQENMRLRVEVAALKAETEKLRQMLMNA
ncbi:unnamed protein product [Soboliphyme baturini]|uniref:BZIP domain-containing protein n=1 Tax=Soboliphyme baturini TaxID=241478 RepID=A0A183IK21_9BILA|nr:unnamed protein product [Soboliphyme baturini]